MDDKTVNKVLLDVQKEYARSNKIKDKIIVLLIVLMFAEAVVGYSGFVYYESQFETTTTEKIEVGTEGETRTTTRRRVGEGSGRKTGKSTTGQKRCPNCGKFMK